MTIANRVTIVRQKTRGATFKKLLKAAFYLALMGSVTLVTRAAGEDPIVKGDRRPDQRPADRWRGS